MATARRRVSRFNKLTQTVLELYGDYGAYDIVQSQDWSSIVVANVQVTAINDLFIELTHLFNDDVYYPVRVSRAVHDILKVKDVFLMTLGQHEKVWEVLWMSPPYEAVDWR